MSRSYSSSDEESNTTYYNDQYQEIKKIIQNIMKQKLKKMKVIKNILN